MKYIFFAIISFLFFACNNTGLTLDQNGIYMEQTTFDVVEKKLEIRAVLPKNLESNIDFWFDNKVKINGFEGEMKFIISEYLEEISSINNGKRVDVSLSFNVILNHPSLSRTKTIRGNVSSYGTLTGSFSLAEFDTVIQNTQNDLVLRLSRDLNSKI